MKLVTHMGLKGKIEAIIYAAEEPVSLEQIALLVKEPALQELTEEARAEAARAAETQSDAAQSEEAGAEIGAENIEAAADATAAEQPQPAPETGVPDSGASSEEPQEPALPSTAAAADVPGEEIQANSDLSATPLGETAVKAEPVATTQPEPSSAPATSDQPLAEASEKTKASVAPKRRAKADIPPEVRAKVRATLEELIADYGNPYRGMEIRQIAGGYRMTTKPEHHDVVKAFAKSLKPPLRLSLPALETLAVIAYKQPVTAPEVGEIRGVDSQGVIATLLDRKLITTAGRKAVIGRPILYKTTKEFLMRFGLNEISELPSMEEFEKLALEAGQVDMFNPEEEKAASADGVLDRNMPEGDESEAAEPAVDGEAAESQTGDPQADGPELTVSPATPPEGETQSDHSGSIDENHPTESEEPVR